MLHSRIQETLCGAAFIAAVLLLLCQRGYADHAATQADIKPIRIYLDSRPTEWVENQNTHADLIFRELPRQALFIAAQEQFPGSCEVNDSSLEPDTVAQPADTVLGVDHRIAGTAHGTVFRAILFGADGAPLDMTELPIHLGFDEGPDAVDIGEKVDQLVESNWIKIVADRAHVTLRPLQLKNELPLPPKVEAFLKTVDLHHAFLAARLLHSAMADTGASTLRLASLARAYANLGDATRHLFNSQSSAFFARALIYSDQVTRLAPNDPQSWWARGYAEAIFGLPIPASAHLDRGDLLAKTTGQSAPGWVELAHELARDAAAELAAKSSGPAAPLASYFALLTVEHAVLPSLPINFGRLALNQNPGALRALAVINDNSGVGPLHAGTELAPRLLNRLMARLATDADDADVRHAAEAAAQQQFSQSAILKLLADLRSRPSEAGQLLPWSTYAAMAFDEQFVDAVRRLFFVSTMWGVDPSDELAQWKALLEHHRYVAFLDTFHLFNAAVDPGALDRARQIKFKDTTFTCPSFNWQLHVLGLDQSSPDHSSKVMMDEKVHMDPTAWAVANELWERRQEDGDIPLRIEIAKALDSVAPNHPQAIAVLLILDWAEMQPRLAEIRKLADHPSISYALGRAELRNGNVGQGLALLQQTTLKAPDKNVFARIAQVYLDQHDDADWQHTWDDYLARSEDYGLDHAQACKDVAQRLFQHHHFDAALPYAQKAAESYSGWGLEIDADVLTALKQYDQAQQVLQNELDRYQTGWPLYSWCKTTGRGDPSAAATLLRSEAENPAENAGDAVLSELGFFCYLEGDIAGAGSKWRRAGNQTTSPDPWILTALSEIEQHHTAEPALLLQKVAQVQPKSAAEHLYMSIGAEMARLLQDNKAIPAASHDFAQWIDVEEAPGPAATVGFVMGRLAEMRGASDRAKEWYGIALQTPPCTADGRAVAAVAMRRLGEDPNK